MTLGVAVPLELEGTAPSGSGVIKGTDTSSGNRGYVGGSLYGAYGEDTNTGCFGYLGGGGWGAYGQSPSGNWGTLGTNASGAFGWNSSGNFGYLGDSDYGVYGSHSNGNYGYLGANGVGVYGSDPWGTWGYLGGAHGVVGMGPSGNWGYLGSDSRGVYGVAATASDYAGYFNGDVYCTGTMNKSACSFVIDHPLDPENKLLRHTSVESPENLLIYRGKVQLDGAGEAVVEMPDYFEALTKENEATVTLTPIGRPFLTGYQWRSDHTGFTTYGEPDHEVSWVVYADRDDPVMRQLARPVEEEKGPDNKFCDRGKLLHPAAYGYPESMGRDHEELERFERERLAHVERMQKHVRTAEEDERDERMESRHPGIEEAPAAPRR